MICRLLAMQCRHQGLKIQQVVRTTDALQCEGDVRNECLTGIFNEIVAGSEDVAVLLTPSLRGLVYPFTATVHLALAVFAK